MPPSAMIAPARTKKGNGQQGEFVHAAGDLDHHGVQGNIDPPGADQGGQAEGVGDRNR